MKKEFSFALMPLILLALIIGCSMPESKTSLTSNEQKNQIKPVNKTASRVYMGPYTDSSGQIQITIYDASVTGQHNTVTAYIADDEVLVGGGAYTSDNGCFLTGSYPCLNINGEGIGWTAQSKDHFIVDSHQTIVEAVGMKIKDSSGNFLPKSTVSKYIKIFYTTSGYAQHPAANATIPSNYELLGGGAQVQYPFGEDGINVYGNLLTESRPNDSLNGWYAASKDHWAYSPAMITSYAIGFIKDQAVPNFGYIYVRLYSESTAVSTANTLGQLTSKCSSSYALIGVGGYTRYNGYGRCISSLLLVANQYGMICERDWLATDTGTFMVRAIGITRVPSLY